jgi:hypothetical protein
MFRNRLNLEFGFQIPSAISSPHAYRRRLSVTFDLPSTVYAERNVSPGFN